MSAFADYSSRIAPLAPVGPFDERNKIAKNFTLIRHAWIGPCNFLEEDFGGSFASRRLRTTSAIQFPISHSELTVMRTGSQKTHRRVVGKCVRANS